jgi:hypothetical protein
MLDDANPTGSSASQSRAMVSLIADRHFQRGSVRAGSKLR